MKLLLEIYFAFCRVGALTFGGGYAMLPILRKEAIDKKAWITEEEMIEYYALSQCLPGIIMANTCSFVGQKIAGTKGGVAATFGAVTPSIIIITILASFLTQFAEYAVVQNAFAGIRVAVVVLILNAIFKLWKSSIVDKPSLVLFLIVMILSAFTDLSPVVFVICAAIAGIIITKWRTKQ